MTIFCANVNEHLQSNEFHQSCRTLLRSYILNISDHEYSFLTSVVYHIQKMILEKARRNVQCMPIQNVRTCTEDISNAGPAKIRYIGEYCVAKLRYDKCKKINTCMFNPKKKNDSMIIKHNLKFLEHMETEYHILL